MCLWRGWVGLVGLRVRVRAYVFVYVSVCVCLSGCVCVLVCECVSKEGVRNTNGVTRCLKIAAEIQEWGTLSCTHIKDVQWRKIRAKERTVAAGGAEEGGRCGGHAGECDEEEELGHCGLFCLLSLRLKEEGGSKGECGSVGVRRRSREGERRASAYVP